MSKISKQKKLRAKRVKPTDHKKIINLCGAYNGLDLTSIKETAVFEFQQALLKSFKIGGKKWHQKLKKK